MFGRRNFSKIISDAQLIFICIIVKTRPMTVRLFRRISTLEQGALPPPQPWPCPPMDMKQWNTVWRTQSIGKVHKGAFSGQNTPNAFGFWPGFRPGPLWGAHDAPQIVGLEGDNSPHTPCTSLDTLGASILPNYYSLDSRIALVFKASDTASVFSNELLAARLVPSIDWNMMSTTTTVMMKTLRLNRALYCSHALFCEK